MYLNIITGEKIQEIANVYLGIDNDFNNNPYINNQTDKHKNMLEINTYYNNPKIVFCYSHRIDSLANIIHYFINDFVLITHNSDKNIVSNNHHIIQIYNCNKLLKWYAQNLCFESDKLFLLPIGIANNQWEHGRNFTTFYKQTNTVNLLKIKKNKSIYFFFEIHTNIEKRSKCYNSIINKIPFLNKISPYENFKRLSEYEYCICPEGNGIDTHRLWEALYLKCVPIVIKSPFIDIIKKNTNLPMIILNSWDDLDISSLQDYKTFDFINSEKYLNIDYYRDKIKINEIKNKNNSFDIVIPVGPNDINIIKIQLEYTKKNIIGYRNIYLISYDKTLDIEGCITISENIFPFSIDTVSKYHGKNNRNGWYLQQLLKLYAGEVIPNILNRYLVIDSDTFFLKPTSFINDDKCLYNFGTEYHTQYFEHMKKLDENLVKQDMSKSGICHHMIFETKYIKLLFNKIESIHNDIFYNIFLKNIIDIYTSGASEYEIYFNFMLTYYSNEIIIRELKWCNTKTLDFQDTNDNGINNDYDYVSYHYYMR